jgi:peptidoglycan LD-endopeptidase CwlK
MSPWRRLFGWLGSGRPEAPAAPPVMAAGVPVSTVGEAPAPPLHRSAMLTPRDLARLKGVHPDLVRVVTRARQDVEFFVAQGLRTVEEQRELVARGASRTMNSRHLTGHAVDLYPVSDVPIPKMTMRDMAPVISAMRRAAQAEGVEVVHGADWKSFVDPPHHELSRSRYPG